MGEQATAGIFAAGLENTRPVKFGSILMPDFSGKKLPAPFAL